MRRGSGRAWVLAASALAAGLLWLGGAWWSGGEEPSGAPPEGAPPEARDGTAAPGAPPRDRARAPAEAAPPRVSTPPRDAGATGAPPAFHDVEALKQEIYARRIDRVDRLHLLEDLVQTGDADVRELWGETWGGVDDWKRESNGFRLDRAADGTPIFIPDAATMRTYSFFESIQPFVYDESSGEFVRTIDYYGKPIYNVLKFLDEDVAVMMTISGAKVDLQIYEKGASGDGGEAAAPVDN